MNYQGLLIVKTALDENKTVETVLAEQRARFQRQPRARVVPEGVNPLATTIEQREDIMRAAQEASVRRERSG